MWGCNFSPISGGWWGGFFPGGILSMLIWVLIILLLVYVVIRIFRSQTGNSIISSRDRIDSLSILKRRFAKGEISKEEFLKMKQVLYQP
jgi:putative membrane protein